VHFFNYLVGVGPLAITEYYLMFIESLCSNIFFYSLPLDLILSQINPVHILWQFPKKNFVHISWSLSKDCI